MAKQYDLGLVRVVAIDDAAPSSTKVYSSQKTQNELDQLSQQMADYRTAVNLLINSDWRIKKNIVNQRGQDHYVGIGDRDVYTIDRWVISWQDGLELTVGDGYIQKGNKLWKQRLENIDPNKVYTGALALLDGTVYVHSGKLADGFGDWNNSFWCYFDNNMCHFQIQNNVTQPMIWAALYEGAYTAETLPPYRPKGYAAELAECRRYFKKLYARVFPWYTESNTLRRYYLSFGEPMRTGDGVPSVDISGMTEMHIWTTTNAELIAYEQTDYGVNVSALSDALDSTGSEYLTGYFTVSKDL